jgi:hypothetical protein
VGSRIVILVERAGPAGWQRAEELDVDPDGKFQCLRCYETCAGYGDAWVHESNVAQLCPPDQTLPGVPDREVWFIGGSPTLFDVLVPGLSGSHPEFGSGPTPLDAPRGLPADVSEEVSYSHATVGELLAYDWNQMTHHAGSFVYRPTGATRRHNQRAAVAREQARLDRYGGPPGYPFTPAEPDGPAGVQLTWRQPLWRDTPVSLFGAVMRMARLADGDLDRVRGVFWVDS